MASGKGRNQDEPVGSRETAKSSITDLLHGLRDRNRKPGQAKFQRTLSPLLLANLFLSAVLCIILFRIAVQGIRLREQVEQLTQENKQLSWRMESIQGELHSPDQEMQSDAEAPAKVSSENAPDPDSPATPQGPSETPIRSTSTPRKTPEVKKYAPGALLNKSKVLYRLKGGDSLHGLSKRFGVSVDDICKWNNMEPADTIPAGQVITLYNANTADNSHYVTTAEAAKRDDDIENNATAAIEQVSEARAQAQAAERAVGELRETVKARQLAVAGLREALDAQRLEQEQTLARLEQEAAERKELEERLAADVVSKEAALAQVTEAREQAEAAQQAVGELQEALDGQRKEQNQALAQLEQEEAKRQEAQEKPASDPIPEEKPEHPDAEPAAPEEGRGTTADKPLRETVHVIREGENLFRIGIRYDVSWKTLVEHNQLKDADAIYVGQKIRIPTPEKSESVPASTDGR